nr:protein trichome birefringence-like 5 [Quercus suber]
MSLASAPPTPTPISQNKSSAPKNINGELSVENGEDPDDKNQSFGEMDGNGSDSSLASAPTHTPISQNNNSSAPNSINGQLSVENGEDPDDKNQSFGELGGDGSDSSLEGEKTGDSNYLNWRWKPESCDLPRFNAADFLMRLRGKRLMLVGDSMNRNQFESMLCLLREGLPNKSRMYEVHGHKISKGRGYFVFKFEDYNCTLEFVRSHFLVKEGVRINGQGNSNPTLSIDQIDKTAKRWKHADILVFNTGHWWTHGKTARGKNYYKEGDYIYPKFDSVEAYRRALKTWANWIDKNVNPKKQLVFYRGYSSAHFRGGDWDSGGSCNGETEPVLSGAILNNYPLKMKIVEEVVKEMKVPVRLLNVTKLTNFRKDGHPSVYGKKVIAGQKVSTRRQDCSHWCLPGVPDAWNELIYATMVFQQIGSKTKIQ